MPLYLPGAYYVPPVPRRETGDPDILWVPVKQRAASPSIGASSSGVTTPAGTTTTMAITALSASAGDLLLTFHFFDGNNPGDFLRSLYPAGWVVMDAIANTTSTITCQAAYKYATGGETDFALTHGAAITRNRTYKITGHAGSAQPPVFCGWQGANAAGPPAVTPNEFRQSQDILAILACTWENTTPSGGVTGYTNDFNAGSGSLGGRCERRAISSFSGTEDPANYTTGSGNRAGYTCLIASDGGDPDLTFPIVRNEVRTRSGSGSSSIVCLLPIQRQAGDLVVIAVGILVNVTISSGVPSGWTTQVNRTGGGSGGERLLVFWKVMDGTETDSFTLTMSGTCSWCSLSHAIFNVDSNVSVLSADAGSGAAGATTDPPNLSADADLWLAVSEHEASAITANPTNYTHKQGSLSLGGASGGSIATAFRQLAASSENPGTYGITPNAFSATATLAFGKANPRFFKASWS